MPSPTTVARAEWVSPGNTGFDVPVLDLISHTGKLIATTTELALAERAASWTSSVGDELNADIEATVELKCDLRFPYAGPLPDGLLFTPAGQDDKWVLAVRGNQILIARSWTARTVAVAECRRDETSHELRVTTIRLSEESGLDYLGPSLPTTEWLIRSHALGERVPLPVSDAGAQLLESEPTIAFSMFGHKAICAAISWDPPAPSTPLRTDGRMLLATRNEDHDEIRRLFELGLDVDPPSPTQGFTPLHLTCIRGDTTTMRVLLECGADPNLGDQGGNSAMGRCVVHGGTPAMLEQLVSHGGDSSATNHDDFGLLHVAAESDNAEVVPWLVQRGLDLEARTRHGHTPLQIAIALQKLSVARALADAGADREVRGPNGESLLELAKGQEKVESAALVQSWGITT